MPLSVCPTDVVEASIETVWSLLTHSAGLGEGFDVRVVSVEPPGRAAPGQQIRLTAPAGPLWLPLTFTITEVLAEMRHLATAYVAGAGPTPASPRL